MAGVTLDSGALIGFERAARRTMTRLKLAEQFGYELTIPTPVIVEAWRGGKRSARVAALLEACVIEPLFPDLARIAGEAIAAVKGATVVDAVVMASAARRGDRVLTADFADLDRLRAYFPDVRRLQVWRCDWAARCFHVAVTVGLRRLRGLAGASAQGGRPDTCVDLLARPPATRRAAACRAKCRSAAN